jgi:diguanylate cyclase (GGDEF)-like protein
MNRSRNDTSTQRDDSTGNSVLANNAFDDFLSLTEDDRALLTCYQSTLNRSDKQFSAVLFDYLAAFPTAAKLLQNFQKRGGKSESLSRRDGGLRAHILSGDLSEASTQNRIRLGEKGRRHGVEPAWILGAYQLYLEHLQALIRGHADIADLDRSPLETSVTKLVLRDMGLVLEGYWSADARRLQRENAKVAETQTQTNSLLSNIPQLLWSVDVASGKTLFISPSTQKVFKTDSDLPIPCFGTTIAKDRRKLRLAWETALAGERAVVECRVRQPDGKIRWYRRTLSPFLDADTKVTRIDGIMEDTTDEKRMLQKLRTLATTDSLTGLPNRSLFEDRFKQAIHAAARRNHEVVLVMIDIDHFKKINDTLGHPAGDQVLTLLGQRLGALLRATDTVARLGGDEFAVLMPDVSHGRKTAAQFLKKMLKSLSAPFQLGDHELFVRTGIGVAVCPEHGDDVDTLMRNADIALYATKNSDVDYLFFDNASTTKGSRATNLSADLRKAIKGQELLLHYQPQIDVRRRTIVGVEALVRWSHPHLGLLMPEKFLPAAERSGFIRTVTYWVLEDALRQCSRWQRLGWRLRVTVNVSARALRDPNFVERTCEILKGLGVPASVLEIEVTENTVMSDVEHVRDVLAQLAKYGVRIAIDDFGTGFSSLALLDELSVDTLKIDKSFVQIMTADKHARNVARSAVNLGHDLGCTLVAEGVENRDTWEMLSALGCDNAQGFLVSKPLLPEALDGWLIKSPWNSGSAPREKLAAASPSIEPTLFPHVSRAHSAPDRRLRNRGRETH